MAVTVAIARVLFLFSFVLHRTAGGVVKPPSVMSKPRGAPAAVAIVPEDVEMNVIRPSGRVLPGTLTVPQGAERKEGPVVVFLHGTHSNKDHNFVPDLAAKLCKDHGIRSFRFDFRVDKSAEEPEHRYRFSGYKDDLDDMEVAVAQLQRSGYTPFCLFGHSRGANDALLYASTRLARGADGSADAVPDNVFARLSALSVSDAPSSSSSSPSCASPPSPADILLNPAQLCLVCAAPRFNMPNMLPTLFAAEKVALLATEGQFVWNEELGTVVTQADADVTNKEMDMAASVAAIPAEVPLLLLHGTDDELIPVADADAYKAARPAIEVTIVNGARHAFRGKKQLKQLLTVCSDWIGKEKIRMKL